LRSAWRRLELSQGQHLDMLFPRTAKLLRVDPCGLFAQMGFSSSPLLPFSSVLPLVLSSLPISLPRSPQFSPQVRHSLFGNLVAHFVGVASLKRFLIPSVDPYKAQIFYWMQEDLLFNCETMLQRLREQGYSGNGTVALALLRAAMTQFVRSL